MKEDILRRTWQINNSGVHPHASVPLVRKTQPCQVVGGIVGPSIRLAGSIGKRLPDNVHQG
jgi:hypothetical protein